MITIASSCLSVEYSESLRQLIITDKRISKVWKQAPFPESISIIETKAVSEEKKLLFSCFGEFPFTMSVVLEQEADLLYTISADPGCSMEQLAFPPAIPAPDHKHFILQTDSEGLLLPVDDCDYPLEQQPIFRCSGGPGMAWLGMIDSNLQSGYMCIYETPYDAEISFQKTDNLIDFKVVWLSSLGKFSYDRRVRMVFFDQGGYVAQCKRYRPYAWRQNHVTSLRSRLNHFPQMAKMLGAVHIYVWDDARQGEFLKELKESGIEKALIIWNPNHLPYPDKNYMPIAKELGYGVGNYELFTDIHPDTPQRQERNSQMPLLLNYYSGKFEFLTAKTKDGGTYSNQFGTYICPAAIHEEMANRINRARQDYPFETLFLDVYQANGLYECYDKRHPLTREGYARSILNNMQFIENTYGVYLGGEFGAEYGAGHGAYVHGMMTLQRTWFDSDATVPGSIYYIGDWKDNMRPSIMLGSRTATPDYHKYSLNEYTRVPLYELVYHDAVVTSWRWEDCNHHYPELWWKKDLFNVLYGNVPLWTLDRARFLTFKNTFVDSYKKVLPWVQQVCLDEMVNHCFLSEDHLVQKSSFSSGKSVIVNFGSKDFIWEGLRIPARDYVALTESVINAEQ